MPQDAYTLNRIAGELYAALCGGKISRINQPTKDDLTFIIYTKNGTVKLDACLGAANCRLSLGAPERTNPSVAPNFCMLLRKHLQNAEITDIGQVGFERIIFFDFICVSDFSSEKMKLYFEIMGKYSNAALVKDGVIVGALKSTYIGENTKRVLFTGAKYKLPEPQDKIPPYDTEGLETALKGGGDPVETIANRVTGISYATAAEICAYYGGMPTPAQLNGFVYGGPYAPCITYANGEPKDFKVYSSDAGAERFESVLAAQSEFYARVCAKQLFEGRRQKLKSAVAAAVKKVEKRLSAIENKLLECRETETVRIKGELLTACLYAVPKGAESFYADNYYDPSGGKMKIELDPRLTPPQNAQRYFKRYAKLKRTRENADAQRAETLEKYEYLKSIQAHICAAERLIDLEETEQEMRDCGILKTDKAVAAKKLPPPFRTYIIGGFKIFSGRNNIQNDRLMKSCAPEDLWLHTQKFHSSHVVISTGGKAVPDEVLLAAAEICAFYSDGRGGSKIPVDYTRGKYVKKPKGSSAGFAVYTDYKTVLADPNPHEKEAETL